MIRHPSQWPPLQQGEAKRACTRDLYRYVSSHRRWFVHQVRQWPFQDHYLAQHRANSARAELLRRDPRARRFC